MTPLNLLHPEWPAPARVRALITTRSGGVSSGAYASLNLGTHVGDAAESVENNRARLLEHLPAQPQWLTQVHGTRVVDLDRDETREADAAVTRAAKRVAVILTADCLPLLLCDQNASVVGAVHAGWRGLCNGVIEAAVAALEVAPQSVFAFLGPAIGPAAYEVGDEVRAAFVARDAQAAAGFVQNARGRWQADLFALARQRLTGCGVTQIFGGNRCTLTERADFFSFRRDGVTGRMGTLIWLE